MKYSSKSFSDKVKSRIARHKRVRYHNDAVLFPDSTLLTDRKRRKSLKKQQRASND